MSTVRALFLFLLFFGGLYILRDPVSHAAPNLNKLVVLPFKDFFANLQNATTSLSDYSPLPGSSNAVATTAANTKPRVAIATSTKTNAPALPPVTVSNPSSVGAELTIDGIISYTNIERQKAGLAPLKRNNLLLSSASIKLDDMFKNQYFEHVSPSGVSVSDLAQQVGYNYIVIGENLALGNFGSDSKVVAAWMASPGHKANILSTKYQEIGIAVAEREYKGQKQWIAIQHFGTPLSSCPGPSAEEKRRIDTEEKALSTLEQRLSALKKEIDQSGGDVYNKKVEEYNSLVAEYNTLLASLKERINRYNESVKKFNSCAGL